MARASLGLQVLVVERASQAVKAVPDVVVRKVTAGNAATVAPLAFPVRRARWESQASKEKLGAVEAEGRPDRKATGVGEAKSDRRVPRAAVALLASRDLVATQALAGLLVRKGSPESAGIKDPWAPPALGLR